jgi:hypothetical protein
LSDLLAGDIYLEDLGEDAVSRMRDILNSGGKK